MEIWLAILFGIVEGITEWLPVSSTGHMILLEAFIDFPMSEEFMEMFLVVVQLGAILAVVLLFWQDINPFCIGKNREKTGGKLLQWDIVMMWLKIIVACIPAVVLELLAGEQLEEHFYNYQTVAIMLVVVGVGFLLVENWNQAKIPKVQKISEITYRYAFAIGVFQLFAAAFPGTSRSGATIIGGLLLGLSRKVAAEFTFYLAIPVMAGASVLKLWKFGMHFTGLEVWVLLAGMITAFFVSVLVIKFLMQYIKNHDFKVFGWYRIVLGGAVFLIFALRAGM